MRLCGRPRRRTGYRRPTAGIPRTGPLAPTAAGESAIPSAAGRRGRINPPSVASRAGNLEQAAQYAGMSRATFWRKRKKHGL
ncbi:helix-turn-helix domain-containing protein [Methylomonas koyamae]|uniref:helix-turn-helix domain-containing protein n=1 Tax=Methylomonas koyamae TaxID=702114 RepID=UPI00278C6F73|nr:helix-turn-helix domain-containing protein [Methylomonas koyamae]